MYWLIIDCWLPFWKPFGKPFRETLFRGNPFRGTLTSPSIGNLLGTVFGNPFTGTLFGKSNNPNVYLFCNNPK